MAADRPGAIGTSLGLVGPNTVRFGEALRLTALVVRTEGGAPPEGLVIFDVNGTIFARARVEIDGTAEGFVSGFSPGTYTVGARFEGGGFDPASDSRAYRIVAFSTPANDAFAGAFAIPVPGLVAATNAGATREAGEPLLFDAARPHSVWWNLTPSADGPVTLETCGTAFDTVLGVYTGATVGTLTQVAVNDDTNQDGCDLQSRVAFQGTAGTTYRVVVASFLSGTTGNIQLTADFPYAPSIPTVTTIDGPAALSEFDTATYFASIQSRDGPASGNVRLVLTNTQTQATPVDISPLLGQNGTAGLVFSATDPEAVPTPFRGTYALSATFLGTPRLRPSVAEIPVLISPPPTVPQITLNGPGFGDFGDPGLTYEVVVSAQDGVGDPLAIGGLVTLLVDNQAVEQRALQDNRATFAPSLPLGSSSLRATFEGQRSADVHFAPGSSDVRQVVISAAPQVTLTGPASGLVGQTLTYSVAVRSAAGTPRGSVIFQRNGEDVAIALLDAQGNAIFAPADFPAGAQQVRALFFGVAGQGWRDSSSNTLTTQVNRPTTTTLSGPEGGLVGQDQVFVATVRATGATPTGTVSFRRGGVEFATGVLSGPGAATATVSNFPTGTHQITAHYPGATGFAPSASAARAITIRATPLEFLGGGTVFELTAACAAGGWANTPHPARLRYGPGETNGMPSQVGILFPSGAEHLQTWQPLAQSTLNYDALGRQMWTLFVLQQPFPRMTPVQRRITQPANGTDIATATEVMLRLRVSGFGGIPGCGATVAGVVRRAG